MAQLRHQLIVAKVPEEIARSASAPVGFVNFYPAFRNAARTWIKKNRKEVETMARLAASASSDLEAREAYSILDSVSPIEAANGRHLHPAALITPLLACLDPRARSPIINSRDSVQARLRALGLRRSSVRDQFDGLVNLIGQAGISDAFELDTSDVDLVKALSPTARKGTSEHGHRLKPKDLHERDDGDVEYLRKAATVKMRRLHNSMTNALLTFFSARNLIVTEGSTGPCMYDALITQYSNERHLLVEVKTDSEQPTCRLAVGQLLDYRSQLRDRALIDLAVLFPKRPRTEAQRFLNDVGVRSLWFERGLSVINDLSNPQPGASPKGTT